MLVASTGILGFTDIYQAIPEPRNSYINCVHLSEFTPQLNCVHPFSIHGPAYDTQSDWNIIKTKFSDRVRNIRQVINLPK